MGRKPQPELRVGLLDASTDYALEHGLPDRLEPFVVATGASARVLLYHFGSRDELLRAVLECARERQLAAWAPLLRGGPGEPYAAVLDRVWAAMTGTEGARYLSMFGRLRQDGQERLWPGFPRLATTEWLEPVAEGLRVAGRPESPTLVLAVIRGLLMDLDATGDRDRVDAAFREWVAGFSSPAG